MIVSLLQNIELDADIVIANQTMQHKALSRLEDIRIVLVLLSDAYVQSPTCREEFRAAVRSCLPLVPILMPCTASQDSNLNNASTRWTGPGPEDKQYWRHAADMCQAMPMGAETATDWAFLEHFKPLSYVQVPD
jgi:hypothetical protein